MSHVTPEKKEKKKNRKEKKKISPKCNLHQCWPEGLHFQSAEFEGPSRGQRPSKKNSHA
jgi:hypothetical protein